MGEHSIGEIAKRTGIASSAIRYYESQGLVPRPARRGGRRVYDERVLKRLALIQLAKRAGFTIAEIGRLLGGFARKTPPGKRWRRLAEHKLRELDERIAEARRMQALLRVVAECECPSFDHCTRSLRS